MPETKEKNLEEAKDHIAIAIDYLMQLTEEEKEDTEIDTVIRDLEAIQINRL